MSALAQDLARVAFIGIGATAVMDLWLWLLKQLHVPTLDFALVGRWVGHLARGRWSHEAIAKAAPVRGELVLGWITHYASGVAFAALLVLLCGTDWARSPSLVPALLVGIGTVLVPLFVMQPAMGAGIASSKTPTPWRNRARSLLTHTVFGAGLYAAVVAIEWLSR
jgi:putative flippase GtrA